MGTDGRGTSVGGSSYFDLFTVILFMVTIHSKKYRTWFSCWIIVFMLFFSVLGSGCRQGVYRVYNLPADCMAPSPTNSENLNLAGIANATASKEIIQFGDVLEVTMVTDFTKLTTTTTPVRVADDGTIIVPLVGKVAVVGMQIEQAEQVVAAESISRGMFRNPCITLTMKECRTNKITVIGAVDEPGTVELPRASSSLLNALVAAGGMTKSADTESVEVRRTVVQNLALHQSQGGSLPANAGAGSELQQAGFQQEQLPSPNSVLKVNLNAASQGGQKIPDLQDGDVVYVAKRVPKPIYVIGLVRKPGEFPMPINQELRVLDALALAGGCSNPVAENILVIRRMPNKEEPVRIAVSLQAAKQGQDNMALAPGDTISVEQTPATAVVDVIQTFIRFGIGTSVSMF
jgi:polysaccharide biosynthesis/export protein